MACRSFILAIFKRYPSHPEDVNPKASEETFQRRTIKSLETEQLFVKD